MKITKKLKDDNASILNQDKPMKNPAELRKTNFFNLLSDEIILLIFGHLTSKELITCSLTSKTWLMYALDKWLWKKLYLVKFPIKLKEHRKIKNEQPGQKNALVTTERKRAVQIMRDQSDWRSMYLIQNNWKQGKAVENNLNLNVESKNLCGDFTNTRNINFKRNLSRFRLKKKLWKKRASGSWIVDNQVEASEEEAEKFDESCFNCNEKLFIYSNDVMIECKVKDLATHLNFWRVTDNYLMNTITTSKKFSKNYFPTCFSLSSPNSARKGGVVGYSNGGFSIYSFDVENLMASNTNELITFSRSAITQDHKPIISAGLIDNYIITCSDTLNFTIFKLQSESSKGKLKKAYSVNVLFQMKSFICCKPIEISICSQLLPSESLNSKNFYKIFLCYTTPILFQGFEPGIQEIVFNEERIVENKVFEYSKTSSEKTNFGFLPFNELSAFQSIAPINALKFDYPYLVIAHQDETIQLYKLTEKNLRHLGTIFENINVCTISFSSESRRLITGGAGGLKIWEIPHETNDNSTFSLYQNSAIAIGYEKDFVGEETCVDFINFDDGKIVCNIKKNDDNEVK
ncbi:hypothetical protein HDU92_005700, partial [Lobulomyces angularis]